MAFWNRRKAAAPVSKTCRGCNAEQSAEAFPALAFPDLCVRCLESEDGVAALKRGDYATALQLLGPLADQGNARAQFKLGVMYYEGQGVPQDYAEAVKWYRRAADQGYADGQGVLGFFYEKGDCGVPQDYA
jgi:TPR repeat protein